MPGEAFTKSTDEFDLDDWISGAKLPEKSATVYGRADLVAEYEALDRQLRGEGKPEFVDDRLTGDPRVSLAQRMDQIRKDMEASALTFRFRAVLDSETKALREGNKGSEEDLTFQILSVQCVAPRVSPEQWPRIREKIGDGQFAHLLEAAGSASYDRQVSVPFSLAASALLKTEES